MLLCDSDVQLQKKKHSARIKLQTVFQMPPSSEFCVKLVKRPTFQILNILNICFLTAFLQFIFMQEGVCFFLNGITSLG